MALAEGHRVGTGALRTGTGVEGQALCRRKRCFLGQQMLYLGHFQQPSYVVFSEAVSFLF